METVREKEGMASAAGEKQLGSVYTRARDRRVESKERGRRRKEEESLEVEEDDDDPLVAAGTTCFGVAK